MVQKLTTGFREFLLIMQNTMGRRKSKQKRSILENTKFLLFLLGVVPQLVAMLLFMLSRRDLVMYRPSHTDTQSDSNRNDLLMWAKRHPFLKGAVRSPIRADSRLDTLASMGKLVNKSGIAAGCHAALPENRKLKTSLQGIFSLVRAAQKSSRATKAKAALREKFLKTYDARILLKNVSNGSGSQILAAYSKPNDPHTELKEYMADRLGFSLQFGKPGEPRQAQQATRAAQLGLDPMDSLQDLSSIPVRINFTNLLLHQQVCAMPSRNLACRHLWGKLAVCLCEQ